ncbi:Pro-Pol polyprotein [Halotydeus destructor]|nr:Pro-Pol polyprotein [Halotydeus destructor]
MVEMFGIKKPLRICVVDRNDEPLFGLDILQKFKIVLDVSKRTMTCKRNNMMTRLKPADIERNSMRYDVKEELSHETGRNKLFARLLEIKPKEHGLIVRLKEDVTIPANHTRHCPVMYENDKKEVWVIKNASGLLLRYQIMVPRGVVDTSVKTLPLTNFSDQKVALKKNTKIAFGEQVVHGRNERECYDKELYERMQGRKSFKESMQDVIHQKWSSIVLNDVLDGSNKSFQDYPRLYDPSNLECRKIMEEIRKKVKMKSSEVVESYEQNENKNEIDFSIFDIDPELNDSQKQDIKDFIKDHIESFAFSNADCFSDKIDKLPKMKIPTGENLPVGFPKRIITDQGTQFTSDTFKMTLQGWGIEHVKTSGYHPQTSGLVENANKTIKARLASLIDENRKDWDVYLPVVTYAINTEIHQITRFSPLYLVYGYKARDPRQNFYCRQDFFPQAWFNELPENMAARIDKARKEAIENLLEHAEKVERLTTPRRLIATFKKGQHVLKLIPVKPQGITKGFWKPWDGPFKVMDVKSDIIYKIQRCKEPFDEHIANVETLRAYDEREETRYIQYSLERKNRFAFQRKNFRDPNQQKDSSNEFEESVLIEIQGKASIAHHQSIAQSSGQIRKECAIDMKDFEDLKEFRILSGVLKTSQGQSINKRVQFQDICVQQSKWQDII